MSGDRKRDGELIACQFVAETADTMLSLTAALLAAASAGDVNAVELRLWSIRRALLAMATSWREAVPGLKDDGGANE